MQQLSKLQMDSADQAFPPPRASSESARPKPTKRGAGGAFEQTTTAFDPEDQKHCKGHTADLRAPAPLAPPRESCVRGNPGPVGLLAFGMTTVMLMFIETSWSDKLFLPTVIAYAAFYGGLGQFVAGLLELLKGNTFAGTAFISYGAFWMGWFMLEFLSKIDHSLPVSLTGKTLWCALWGILTAGFFVVTLRKNFGLMFIFSTLTVTFFLLAGGVYNPNSQKAAGYVGFACGSSAIYTALAMLYQDELGITLPGIGPVHFI